MIKHKTYWTMGIVILLFIALLVQAKVFDTENEARDFYEAEKAKSLTYEIQVVDIVQELDSPYIDISYVLTLYNGASVNGDVVKTIEGGQRFDSTLSQGEIRAALTTIGRDEVTDYNPPKPLYKRTDHALYNVVIKG